MTGTCLAVSHSSAACVRPLKLAIFDFDGTLADTFPFFAGIYNELAVAHGFHTVAPGEFAALRQLTVREIMRHVGLPPWKLPLVTRAFLARMHAAGGDIGLFPGIEQVLVQLVAGGTQVAIVSSNSGENIRRVLGARNTALVSEFECGASLFGKAARLRRVLKRAGVAAADAIYVGDQSTDRMAARAAGMQFGAVAWGYADPAALRRLAPEREFGQVAELASLALAPGVGAACIPTHAILTESING